ncbi:PREDICTED: probable palmitoyltransferase ZDHHC24 [Rhagoletis zephyria]|uniref:probable palmitoyltransferase ZDHHC24 n=1 Tax=Rhagoletis zephyria TaxID=28612 RepID=UPI0008114ADF|nr:PREDICTED: probable palmitoyltransferase ZDHHC24 [Rhagoletis zephyria]
MPATLPPRAAGDWRYCLVCEANSPPRAFHCKNCDRCILRRDHHCVFSACCVGHKNYKYYMGLLFQVAFGSVYAFAFHSPYVWGNMGGLSVGNAAAHLIPIPFYLLGYIDRWTTLCNFLSMLTLIGALFSGGLFAYHLNLLARNQTTYERAKGITQYSLAGGWRANLLETLGPRWPLTVFLSPLLFDSPLPGDGVHFGGGKMGGVREHKYNR